MPNKIAWSAKNTLASFVWYACMFTFTLHTEYVFVEFTVVKSNFAHGIQLSKSIGFVTKKSLFRMFCIKLNRCVRLIKIKIYVYSLSVPNKLPFFVIIDYLLMKITLVRAENWLENGIIKYIWNVWWETFFFVVYFSIKMD